MKLTLPNTAAGASLRVMSLFCSELQRHRLATAMALRDAILATATASEQIEICRTKLAWWQTEIERLFAASPRHPDAKAFAQLHANDAHSQALVREWLVSAEAEIDGLAPEDISQFRIGAFRYYGTLLMLLHDSQHERDAQVHEARECAVALALLDNQDGKANPFDIDGRDFSRPMLKDLATIGANTGFAPYGALAAILQRRLHARAQHTTEPGALRLLFLAWRGAQRAAKHAFRNSKHAD